MVCTGDEHFNVKGTQKCWFWNAIEKRLTKWGQLSPSLIFVSQVQAYKFSLKCQTLRI